MHWAVLAQMASNTTVKQFSITCQRVWQIILLGSNTSPSYFGQLHYSDAVAQQCRCIQQAFSRLFIKGLMCISSCRICPWARISAETDMELAGHLWHSDEFNSLHLIVW